MAPEATPARAPYAAHETQSRGRIYSEPPSALRSEYQRDSDRITHAASFRCLEYKTQVMTNHVDGSFRTRLTHSMEVARLARTLARALGLNEDLAEAIALGHDVGHTPFGHVGQDILNQCMQEYGGFEHNFQSLRVVDKLEEKYADFPGLNLCFETREGLLKRCPEHLARGLGDVGERFLTKRRPSLEAQIVDVADRVAYTNHDLDDGLKLKILKLDEVRGLELYADAYDAASAALGATERKERHVLLHETNRRMINRMMLDVLEETRRRLAIHTPDSIDAVRAADSLLADFSAEMRSKIAPVTSFLYDKFYSDPVLLKCRDDAVHIMQELFGAWMEKPQRIGDPLSQRRLQERESRDGIDGRARAIADYLAGLSDRSACKEHAEMYGDPQV